MAGEQVTTFSESMSIGGFSMGGVQNQVLSDGEVTFRKTIPANSTNYECDIPMTIANVVAMGIEADQDCTVKTNSTSAPDETLALKKNKPFFYDSSADPVGRKFITHDLVKIYVTTGANDTTLKFGAAVDDTPVGTP